MDRPFGVGSIVKHFSSPFPAKLLTNYVDIPGLRPCKLRHISLYACVIICLTISGNPSSMLAYHFDQLDQVLVTKETSPIGHCHKPISRHHRCPARWNRAQPTLGIVEIDSIFAPVVAIGNQLKFLASQRVMRVDYFKASVDTVAIRCS